MRGARPPARFALGIALRAPSPFGLAAYELLWNVTGHGRPYEAERERLRAFCTVVERGRLYEAK